MNDKEMQQIIKNLEEKVKGLKNLIEIGEENAKD